MAELYAMRDACEQKAIEFYHMGEFELCAFWHNASIGFQMRIDNTPMSEVVKE